MSENPFKFATQAMPKIIHWHCGEPSPQLDEPLAAAIGNFDGVHLGHQYLIAKTKENNDLTPAVITFAPHPRRYFKPDSEGFSLAEKEDKNLLLAEAGAKVIISLGFDDAMKNTSASDFMTKILPSFGVKKLYAGKDFAFGSNREGNMELAEQLGKEVGIEISALPLMEKSGEVISSSKIRAFLKKGDMEKASALLGRPYVISGVVEEGDKRGQTIGFPTANIALGDMQQPSFGVYAVGARLPNGEVKAGVANLGMRPSVNDRGVLLEAHLFEYDGVLYEQRLSVMLFSFLRREMKFEGIEELKAQIAEDAKQAQLYHVEHTRLLR